uniref:AAA domain-containing protein n=1 Tax=Toxocara canis TaxID=6265 RepID=A0A183VF86_TOXCA
LFSRPKKVDDIVFQEEVVSVLKKVLEGADLPNLLFYGPPGTGKTSAAVALCRELFKNVDTYHDRVLEMNASDERGIDIVRTKIKEFARRAACSKLPDGSPVIGLKVIILDEADAMTGAAQAALRRTMEKESRTTRFFLICNYISRIISPLTSRCAKFRFKPLSMESQKERLEYICREENVNVEPAALIELIELCGGDMRKSVTYLQTISSCQAKLTPSDVRELSGAVPDSVVKDLLNVCERMNFDEMCTYVESIKRQGYGVYQLMTQLFSLILHSTQLLDTHKSAIFEKMAVSLF